MTCSQKKLKRGVQRDDESDQLFVDNQEELELLANTFGSNSALVELIRVETMSGGDARCTTGNCAHNVGQGHDRDSRGSQEFWTLSGRNCAEGSHRDIQQ
jgi:hypothetical protein